MIKSKFHIHIHSIQSGSIPLLNTIQDEMYVYKKNKIIKYLKDVKSDIFSIEYPLLHSFFLPIRIFRRILRLEVASLIITNKKALVAIKKGAVVYKEESENKFKVVHKINRGSRPLNICKDSNGNIYWGEYFSNTGRDSVHIYSSTNGKEWKIKYTFPPKKIRHIHGIYWDKHRKGLWVLTGDNDSESGLWFTNNEFKTLDCINTGSQKSRAVSIIPLKDRLIVPMDTPREVNYIQEFNIESNKFSKLKELPGSAFHSFSSSTVNLISTVVEPSKVNKAKYIEIFASIDCEKWVSIAKLYEDFWSSISYKFFRYPEIIFMKELNDNSKYVKMYCRGAMNYNNKMITIKKERIIMFINDSI